MAEITGIDAINASNYFKDKNAELSSDYDFNGDGTVDIADYQVAKLTLSNTDTSDDVNFTVEQLDAIFADMIEKDNAIQNYETITEDEANNKAEELIKEIESGDNDPKTVETLNELQEVGKRLTKYIKECSDLSVLLEKKIEKLNSELEALETEKEEKQTEYDKKQADVQEKTNALSQNVKAAIKLSQSMSESQEATCKRVVAECVEEYASGKHPGQSLQSLIGKRLALSSDTGFNTSKLDDLISTNQGLGRDINNLCNDIYNLVSDIKTVTEKYNTVNSICTRTINNRNGILKSAQLASTNYNQGYQKRMDLRNELVKKYAAQGGGLSDSNKQIQSLAVFLNNGELNKMPFADAWYVLTNTFNDIKRLSYGDDYSIKIPKGHSSYQKSVFGALVNALKANYGINPILVDDTDADSEEGYEDATVTATGTTGVKRTDPISFNKDNIKYNFISDNNNDGIFNDASEFLGAKNGWSEMKAYDVNKDGHISGAELQKLQLVGLNQDNGQFTFSNAAEIGISDIDLNSYKRLSSTGIDNNILEGTYELTTNDGTKITGEQTFDTEQNLNNTYGIFSGVSINTANNLYEANPFMEEFQETLDTDLTVANTKNKIEENKSDVHNTIRASELEKDKIIASGVVRGENNKEINDKQIEIEKQKQAETEQEQEQEQEDKLKSKKT